MKLLNPMFVRSKTLIAIVAVVVAGLVASATMVSGCFLGNIDADPCNDEACVAAFGLGSICEQGYCSYATVCSTGHDCRNAFGGGACVDGVCVATLPSHPACTISEPSDLAMRPLVGGSPMVVIGGMFRLDDSSDPPMANSVQLMVRDINGISGLNDGRAITAQLCDVGGPGNMLTGEERQQRIYEVLDYLAGTLGVPFIVGPTTSSDSLTAIGYLKARAYPTVLISPSATSPQLTTEPDDGLFWRTAPSDELQGQYLAQEVVGTYPANSGAGGGNAQDIDSVAVAYIDDAYGLGLATEFQVNFGVDRTQLLGFGQEEDMVSVAQKINDLPTVPDALLMIALDASKTLALITALRDTLLSDPAKIVYLTDGSKDESVLLADDVDEGVKSIIFNQTVGTAPATPAGSDFVVFSSAYNGAFGIDPTGYAFVAHAYDAAYVGAYGLVYALSSKPNTYDGKTVADGLGRLHGGMTSKAVTVGKNEWATAKGALSMEEAIEVTGISGPLDFDPDLGEAPGPIEVWQPVADCERGTPCFEVLNEQ